MDNLKTGLMAFPYFYLFLHIFAGVRFFFIGSALHEVFIIVGLLAGIVPMISDTSRLLSHELGGIGGYFGAVALALLLTVICPINFLSAYTLCGICACFNIARCVWIAKSIY